MSNIYPYRITNSPSSDDDFDCPECDWSGDNPRVILGMSKRWRCPECSTHTLIEDDDPLDEIAPDDSLRS